MNRRRVLAIGLDGYEVSIEARMIAEGGLPNIRMLRERSARFGLDHGPAQRIGLAWEQFATARSPADANRWAAVHFDPGCYEVRQEGTRVAPWAGFSQARTVVFDAPYFDLAHARGIRGLVNWGAHDPGVPANARPFGLREEFMARFGPYPATPWIYGLPWASPRRCAEMGRALAAAVALRARAAVWLLAERLTDWDVGIVVVSEPHSAIEGLWHGIDPTHPLHGAPSAGPAGEGLRSVYREVDALVGALQAAVPDARIVLFSMGGMGANHSDVASMALLPEFLYQRAFGRPLLEIRSDWRDAPDGLPPLGEDESWSESILARIPAAGPPGDEPAQVPRRSRTAGLVRDVVWTVGGYAPAPARRLARQLIARAQQRATGPVRLSLDWMPASRYQPYWSRMPAFALPSFYDGRIRVNLRGREAHGLVELSDYRRTLDELEAALRLCRNPLTGESVVDFVERPADERDPTTFGETDADMIVVWRQTLAFDHPGIGRIGPLPYRRTGGHTGPLGMAYLCGDGIEPGDYGVRSSFDMAPTVVAMAGVTAHAPCSGESVLPVHA